MKIKLTVSYDGTNYCGWQRQKNGLTVQQVLEEAVEKLTGKKATVTGSGRTDSGVHAKAQVAHFLTDATIPAEKFYLALNALLPDDIKVVKSELAGDDFHARFSAKKKTYSYNFYFSDVILPLKSRYACRTEEGLDFASMTLAANALCGEHDFAAFRGVGSSVKDTVRTVYEITFKKSEGGFSVFVTGNGFLYNMVRVIAGALLAVGKGEISADDIKAALKTGERNKAFKTLPANGLILEKVDYL